MTSTPNQIEEQIRQLADGSMDWEVRISHRAISYDEWNGPDSGTATVTMPLTDWNDFVQWRTNARATLLELGNLRTLVPRDSSTGDALWRLYPKASLYYVTMAMMGRDVRRLLAHEGIEAAMTMGEDGEGVAAWRTVKQLFAALDELEKALVKGAGA
jgi:hypothetical protein